MHQRLATVTTTFLLLVFSAVGFAQNLNEIFLHFSEKEMGIPMSVRQKMIDNKGNTLLNYDNYKLQVYDRRANFLQVRTPLDVIYEIAMWRRDGKGDLLVALCETRCGNSCGSTLRFYAPNEDWAELPDSNFIPKILLSDIFDEKKLSKNYLTVEGLLKDLELKTQFILPQSGHDIIVIFTCLDELEKKEYQRVFKYLDGVMIDLIWKKGAFYKSEPYFPAN